MKKSIIGALLLTAVIAHAQEGRVGINTDAPKATIDIQPNANNAKAEAKTNEGILAPRLSKTRIANIETPVEGTLVYATDETTSPISAYTGSDAKVAKITEKGYYFYNGAEWVKVQYQDTNDAEWVYDASTKRINLKRSGQTTGFVNKVYYDAQTGKFFNKQVDSVENSNYLGIVGTRNIDGIGKYITIQKNSADIIANSGTKQLSENILYVNEKVNISNFSVSGQTMDVITASDNASKYIGGNSLAVKFQKNDDTETGYISALGTNATIHKGNIINYITGTNSTSNINTEGSIEYASGSRNQIDINKRVKNLKVASAGLFATIIDNTSGNITKLAGIDIKHSYGGRVQDPNITNVYGVYYDGLRNLGPDGNYRPTNVVNHYGLYLNGVEYAQNNYAIYTNAGKVRVGDLKGTGDRAVYVDADGVLKTGVATVTPAVEVGSTVSMKCDATNRGKINFVPNDSGSDIFGVCLRNADGNYYWGLLTGGGNLTTGGEIFGQ